MTVALFISLRLRSKCGMSSVTIREIQGIGAWSEYLGIYRMLQRLSSV